MNEQGGPLPGSRRLQQPVAGPVTQPVVRVRHHSDLPALLTLLQRTHEQDGYPVRASAVRADWLAADGELHAAVAVDGDRVLGHVALHPADAPDEVAALPMWQQATGRSSDGLAVVSRLFSDRSVPGAGTILLANAAQRALELGRVAVLMVDSDSAARAFYRRRGWREVGTVPQQWGHRRLDAVLMVSPQKSGDLTA